MFDRETIQHEQVGVDEPAVDIEATQQLESDARFDGMQALIIDEDVHNLLALTTVLEKWGFGVTGAGDADEALEALAEEEFVIILMDIRMPSMDGYATMKKIRQDYDCDAVPIVALTSKAETRERDACLQGGANEYLVKPVEIQELKTALEQFLMKKEPGQQ